MGETRAPKTKVYLQCWKEKAGWCAQEGVQNNAISVPKLADFVLHLFRVGLIWLPLVFTIIAFSERQSLSQSFASYLYLQHPPMCKCFDPWDVIILV